MASSRNCVIRGNMGSTSVATACTIFPRATVCGRAVEDISRYASVTADHLPWAAFLSVRNLNVGSRWLLIAAGSQKAIRARSSQSSLIVLSVC